MRRRIEGEREPVPPRARNAPARRLAAELVRLRTAAGLSRADVQEATGLGFTTVYRLETGKAKPRESTLRALLGLYRVTPDVREQLLMLGTQVGAKGWVDAYSDELPEPYLEFIAFETEAELLQESAGLLVPGLLQTESYAQSLISGVLPFDSEEDVDRRVQVRMQRQAVLTGTDPVRFEAVIDEAAFHRVVGGPAVMAGQLRTLLAPRPNVRVQVIPYAVGAHPGMVGSFIRMRFRDPAATDLVYIDTGWGDLFREEPPDLVSAAQIFELLQGVALNQEDSASLIEATARGYEKGNL
jgi:transcriptional regulator with XRE-family HTH domain